MRVMAVTTGDGFVGDDGAGDVLEGAWPFVEEPHAINRKIAVPATTQRTGRDTSPASASIRFMGIGRVSMRSNVLG